MVTVRTKSPKRPQTTGLRGTLMTDHQEGLGTRSHEVVSQGPNAQQLSAGTWLVLGQCLRSLNFSRTRETCG